MNLNGFYISKNAIKEKRINEILSWIETLSGDFAGMKIIEFSPKRVIRFYENVCFRKKIPEKLDHLRSYVTARVFGIDDYNHITLDKLTFGDILRREEYLNNFLKNTIICIFGGDVCMKYGNKENTLTSGDMVIIMPSVCKVPYSLSVMNDQIVYAISFREI
jgi:hypothetical protein|uniref:Uncharacterized protein n=1 Tax=viral metagenome TaxID=1070528 RepID=A0A6C0IV43_9ZZZZ